MTADRFAELCSAELVAPSIAIENESIREALADRDDARVEELIKSEF